MPDAPRTPRAVNPSSTYRVQVTPEFPFSAVRQLIPYLTELGVGWLYLSPVLQATPPGSDHGYDVTDPSRIDASRGGADEFRALTEAAHEAGLGVLVDIVPNHVGVQVPEANPWWWDVLTHGQDSEYAHFFDIDWEAGDGQLVIPVLGAGTEQDPRAELDTLELTQTDSGELRLIYYDNSYPVAPGTASEGLSPRQVHDAQSYRLEPWDGSSGVLENYRRFFAINELAAVRVEDPEVFRAATEHIAEWFRTGMVDGVRVDHVDGLAYPGEFLTDLRDLARAGGGEQPYLVVEKILEYGEHLPAAWPVAGTSGYEALVAFEKVLTDPAAVGPDTGWEQLSYELRMRAIHTMLEPDFRRLEKLFSLTTEAEGTALRVLAGSMPVYRTYSPEDVDQAHRFLTEAADAATARLAENPEAQQAVARLLETLTSPQMTPALQRFQQTTGMVMAKGVEDTSFYRYVRLSSANEVGADPSTPSYSLTQFHRDQAARHGAHPHGMTTLSTHDTKRSEDVRARIQVLGEVLGAEQWARTRQHILELAADPLSPEDAQLLAQDPVMIQLVLEAGLGIWPVAGEATCTHAEQAEEFATLRERLRDYALKAARESGAVTTWTQQHAGYERALADHFVAAVTDPATPAGEQMQQLADRIAAPGLDRQVVLKFLQLTSPGVPDVYQGTELPFPTLVDPDNRRAVDFTYRRTLLEKLREGSRPDPQQAHTDLAGYGDHLKLYVTWKALTARRDLPTELFGHYMPLQVTGEDAIAYARSQDVIAIAARTASARAAGTDSQLHTPSQVIPAGEFIDILTDEVHQVSEDGLAVTDLLATYPVALLLRSTRR